MKTSEVRVGETYLYRGQPVKVISCHKGASVKSKSLWDCRNKRKRKSFILDNGQQVFSDKLDNIQR